MGMKLRWITAVLALSLCGLTACSSRSATQIESGSGTLYVATQGDTSIASYTVTLSSGALALVGSAASTGSSPVAIALTPSLNALFVLNSGASSISSYTVDSGGTLAATSATTPTGGSQSLGLAIDPGGKFLFVANQVSSNISVFSINGTTLTKVVGSPFTTIPAGSRLGTDPVALAVSPTGKFLYVANQLANNVAAFSISAAGALAPLGPLPYDVGTAPSGLAVTPSGAFLYVANSGTQNVSGFAICDKVVTSCSNANKPDGTLTQVPGSPFPAGEDPVAVAIDPAFNFLYVLDRGSNQVSEYSFGSGTGILNSLSPGAVSTGVTPVSFVIVAGATGTNAGSTTTEPTDYLYVANNGSSTLSTFSLSTTTGLLDPVGTPLTTTSNPSAVGAN